MMKEATSLKRMNKLNVACFSFWQVSSSRLNARGDASQFLPFRSLARLLPSSYSLSLLSFLLSLFPSYSLSRSLHIHSFLLALSRVSPSENSADTSTHFYPIPSFVLRLSTPPRLGQHASICIFSSSHLNFTLVCFVAV